MWKWAPLNGTASNACCERVWDPLELANWNPSLNSQARSCNKATTNIICPPPPRTNVTRISGVRNTHSDQIPSHLICIAGNNKQEFHRSLILYRQGIYFLFLVWIFSLFPSMPCFFCIPDKQILNVWRRIDLAFTIIAFFVRF